MYLLPRLYLTVHEIFEQFSDLILPVMTGEGDDGQGTSQCQKEDEEGKM